MENKKIGFIVNRRGGGGKGGRIWDKLEPTVATRLAKTPWKVEYTQHSGHASDLAGEFVKQGYTIVVAVGGDGTISQVVHGYMLADGCSKGCAIGIISSGTGGDFVRTTKTPKDPIQALEVILSQPSSFVDVGHVTCAKVNAPLETNEQYFINICSVGISGAIIKSAESSSIAKYLSGGLVYWLYTYLTGLVYKPPTVQYTLSNGVEDSQDVTDKEMKLYIMALANGQYFGGNMHIAPKADITDNRFDVVCLHDLSLPDAFFKAAPALKSGDLMRLSSHQAFTQRNGTVSMKAKNPSTKVYVEADGEVAGILPATWKVVPHGCRMILPTSIGLEK